MATNRPADSTSPPHYKAPKYPADVYIAYIKSIAASVEKQVRDNPPRRPGDFWRLIDREKDRAKMRMRSLSGEYQNRVKARHDEV